MPENFGKRLVKTAKFYFLDPAVVCYLTRQPSMEAALSGSMGGSFFEGFIVGEAVKHFFNLGKKPPVYFWRSKWQLKLFGQATIHTRRFIFFFDWLA